MSLHLHLMNLPLLRLNCLGIYIEETCLEVYSSQVRKELFDLAISHLGYSKFTKEEWTAMRSLADDRSIIIKKANKDSCVVV